jgi:hypothetical protein
VGLGTRYRIPEWKDGTPAEFLFIRAAFRILVSRVWKAPRGPKCMAEWTPAGTEAVASHAPSGRGLSTRMDTVSNGVDTFRGERAGGRSREGVAEWRSGEAWEGVGDGMARNLLEVLRRSAGRGGGCAHRDC